MGDLTDPPPRYVISDRDFATSVTFPIHFSFFPEGGDDLVRVPVICDMDFTPAF